VKLKIYINKIRLNSGGYDSRGQYYGGGRDVPPLFRAESEDGNYFFEMRAHNREEAKRIVTEDLRKRGMQRMTELLHDESIAHDSHNGTYQAFKEINGKWTLIDTTGTYDSAVQSLMNAR
jgi:hypothetical protein